MKKKVLIAIYVILILMTFKILYNIVKNNNLINDYNNGNYQETRC